MSGLLDRMLGRGSAKGSSAKAKDRLQFILVHDRINLSPERMDAMKQEILAVISKYVSVDSDNVDIALQQRSRNSLLVAEIPFSKTTEQPEAEDSHESTPASDDTPDENDDLKDQSSNH